MVVIFIVGIEEESQKAVSAVDKSTRKFVALCVQESVGESSIVHLPIFALRLLAKPLNLSDSIHVESKSENIVLTSGSYCRYFFASFPVQYVTYFHALLSRDWKVGQRRCNCQSGDSPPEQSISW